MTPHLWLLVYISVVLVLGAIAIGWTDGVWRRHQDARWARMEAQIADYVRRRAEELAETGVWANPAQPRRRSFKHQNLRSALAKRAQIERGDR